MDLTIADLAGVRELYGRGLYVRAWNAARAFGPMKDWTSTSSRLLGGRLAIQLGAPRLGRWLHLHAYRNTPTHHEAIYYLARYKLEKSGPLAAWEFMRSQTEWYEAPPEVRSDWYGLCAFVCARLRDFDRADRWLVKAETMAHDRAWLAVERAAVLEFAERFDDALASARRSLQLQAHFRPGVQATAHLLQVVGRPREAIDLLQDAIGHIESGIVVAHLAGIQIDLRMYADARKSYELYAEMSPLMEPDVVEWLEGRRCDTAYFCSDIPAAIGHSRLAEAKFYEPMRTRLESGPAVGCRTRFDDAERPFPQRDPNLDVWTAVMRRMGGSPSPTAPIVGTLDGLPDIEERLRAEAAGFRAIEFSLADETVWDVVECGLPFLVTMVDAGYSHTQIVTGGDRIRQTLRLTDPSEYRENEAPIHALRERYLSSGPRGTLLLLPADESRFDGMTLPEAAEYDRLAEVRRHLKRFDRPAAASLVATMRTECPDTRVTACALIALARYDASPTQLLAAFDAMLRLFPKDSTTLLSRVVVLRDINRRAERLAMAREQEIDGDPIFSQHLAQLLMSDPENRDEAIRILRRTIRRRPFAAGAWYLLGNLLWEQREFTDSAEIYRFSACLEERDEQFADAYVRAARVLEQSAEAMRFLKTRFQRTRGKLAAPARALFFAMAETDEVEAAFAMLEGAAVPAGNAAELSCWQRAEVGDLMLFHADIAASYNEPEEAAEILRAAAEHSPPIAWLRIAARTAFQRSDFLSVRDCWEKVVAIDPFFPEAYRSLARAILECEGRPASLEWLRREADKHDCHYPLQQLLCEWLRMETSASGNRQSTEGIDVLHRLLDRNPEDAWGWRELGWYCGLTGRVAEALEAVERSRKIEPDSLAGLSALGFVRNRMDEPDEARKAWREILSRSVDYDSAMGELIDLARGDDEKKEAIEDIAGIVRRQRGFGDGLLAFREHAVGILEPDDLYRILNDILDDHPEVWQAWSVTIRQLLTCMRPEEAGELARDATERFPLLGHLWLDLAETWNVRDDIEARIEALRRAVEVAPGWSYVARELAEALESDDRRDEARTVLELAVARSPLEPVNHGVLAENLWEAGESAAALDRLQIALRLDPGYESAWNSLEEWSRRSERAGLALETAREISIRRAGDSRIWMKLSRMLDKPDQAAESLEAIDRAIALWPRNPESWEIKAEKLADLNRFDEARTAAHPEVFGDDQPIGLQGRAAWVESKAGNLGAALSEMKAIVAVEPTYYQGWQYLAEWNNDIGRSEAYLEAATKMMELRPDNPIPLAMRGDARLQLGDRDGAREDLEEAHRIAPGYAWPGILLLDIYLEDENYRGAEAVLARLQEYAGPWGQPIITARTVQIAARQGDREASLTSLRRLCGLDVESSWPLSLAVHECRSAGWIDQTDEALRQSWDGETFHPWTVCLWLDGPEGMTAPMEVRLKAIERVLATHPGFLHGHDMRAEMLARMHRYPEALEACRPAGSPPHILLQARAAWVMTVSGRMEQAIARMRDILADEPDFYRGWHYIARWYDVGGHRAEYLEAAENLVRLEPMMAESWVIQGEARLGTGDKRGARADFQRALELDPVDIGAGLHLFDLMLADGELREASNLLARLQENHTISILTIKASQLAILQKDEPAASDGLREMLTDPEMNYHAIRATIDDMTRVGWGDAVDATLTAMLDDDDAEPHTGRLWVENRVRRGDSTFEERLPVLVVEREDVGREALLMAIELLSNPAGAGRLMEWLNRYESILRADDRSWALVGGAMLRIRNEKLAAVWLSEWEKREPQEAWMVLAASTAMRLVGKYGEALKAHRYALTLPEDGSTVEHRIHVGLEEVLQGRSTLGESATETISEEDLTDDHSRLLLVMTRGLLRMTDSSESERVAAFHAARRSICEAIATYAPRGEDAALSHSWTRVRTMMLSLLGGWRATMWRAIWLVRSPV